MRRLAATVFVVGLLLLPLISSVPTSAADDGEGVAPVWIWIPAIGVEAAIEEVGIDDGRMEVPADPWNVGWYPDLGYLDDGDNVVMAGHVDWWGYGPTVFADLAYLGEGDQIVVGGDDGTSFVYAVTETWTVDATSPAVDVWRIFHPDEDEEHALTLITCTGDFDGATHDARLVVRADLVTTT
jgi:LPXTG-site transpeptidase (sortase) family protein